jgi:glycine dehydrogenase
MPIAPPDAFLHRHLGPSDGEVDEMLATIGVPSLAALIDETIPKGIRSASIDGLPSPLSEADALEELAARASRNKIARSYLGMGFHGTITPPVILRNILENPGWYTAYTPYQAEISQGRLEALLIYQTVVQELCGLEIANASLLDEATAAAEAMTMSHRLANDERQVYFVDERCHPHVLEVLRTRAEPIGIELRMGRAETADLAGAFGALVPYPCTDGTFFDLASFCSRAHDAKVLVTADTDLLACVLVKPPGELGADIAVGNSQRFGVPMGYGGPHAAFMATKTTFQRQMPGRIIGVSRDSHGNPALRMALQTREQHIRRQKATSNICTAQVLLAVCAGAYAVWHGPEGLTRIASRVHTLAEALALGAAEAGLTVVAGPRFDTVCLQVGTRQAELLARAQQRQINLRALGDDQIVIALDETTGEEDLSDLLAVLGALGAPGVAGAPTLLARAEAEMPASIRRTSPFLRQSVFHRHRSETEMLRFLHHLQVKDLALDASMIPLGSCTMKLNATTEMIPVTWPGFGALHPFAPAEQAKGYADLFRELEGWLAAVTGFAAVSLQPNAGSQGEYAGLLAIRGYHKSRGEHDQRSACLIPVSAHGTNPASAAMAGMEVIPVECDEAGNIDTGDLRLKIEQHRDRLGALMVTYPSTHGVFEESIVEICQLVHAAGGLVYMDGANMNAMVGLCRPADLGADVCHLNLHKTFCLRGDTPVTLDTGVQVPLEQLRVGPPVKAWSEGERGVRAAPLEASYRTGRKECVEITLEDGRTIVCTPDHRVLTTEGWVEAGNLRPGSHRAVVGPEAPLDDREADREAEDRFEAHYGEVQLDMRTPAGRDRTLAFFRLLGAALSDGTYSETQATSRRQIALFFGTRYDAHRAIADIELLTGKRPSISPNNQIFGIHLPASLMRAMESLPGFGQPGPRVQTTSTLPEVIRDAATPKAILREFFGGLFGGDGCAPLVVYLDAAPDTLREVRFVQTRVRREVLETLMLEIQQGLARLGVEATIGSSVRADSRWKSYLTVTWGSAFAERVGFRYCAHKSARLTAATAWWRMKETVRAQRQEVASKALEMASQARLPWGSRVSAWRSLVNEAFEQLASSVAVLNPYYAGFQGHLSLNRQHLTAAIEGQMGARPDLLGVRRTHRRAVLPAHNKRGEPTGMPTLLEFLERTGTKGWFNSHTPGGQGYSVTYATPSQEERVEPTMHLGVVSVRPAGIHEVYDLTVTELHSFQANGVVVHNCIPHGGGGPGMGPIGVTAALAPFLPGHPYFVDNGVNNGQQGPVVSAAPWGSASILPISWAYIRMLGGDGLRRATEVAILNANYVASRLDAHFPVLYKGAHGRVAHECILDLRPFKDVGVQVEDVAKRLMDYGFHAPTMSFPVPGTLMVEPTESENKAELDRFCEAMIAIRKEIGQVASGQVPVAQSALRHAPHTALDVTRPDWDRPYDRQTAAFPTDHTRAHKYWPTVGRIDNVYGDRNLFCSCDAWPDR